MFLCGPGQQRKWGSSVARELVTSIAQAAEAGCSRQIKMSRPDSAYGYKSPLCLCRYTICCSPVGYPKTSSL